MQELNTIMVLPACRPLTWLHFACSFTRLELQSRILSMSYSWTRRSKTLLKEGLMRVLRETAVLGLVIYEGHYSDHPGSEKSTNVVQAALMIPKGFGVIWWEAKEYLAYRNSPPASESDCQFRFVPFLDCPSAIRTLLLPQVHPLLVMLLSQMRATRPSPTAGLWYGWHADHPYWGDVQTKFRGAALPVAEKLIDSMLFLGIPGHSFYRLNDGYKRLATWVADFALGRQTPLENAAFCVVNDVDLHLHPSMQYVLLQRLAKIFPLTQFVVSTHSPIIVQAAAELDASIVHLRPGETHVVIENNPIDVRGWRVDQILSSDLFDNVPLRSPDIQRKIDERDSLLANPKLTAKGRHRVDELNAEIGDVPIGSSRQDMELSQRLRDAVEALERPDRSLRIDNPT